MRVHELLALLREVHILASAWTHERGCYAGSAYDVRYHGAPERRDEGYKDSEKRHAFAFDAVVIHV